MEAIVAYEWPGNIRQLGRVMERAIGAVARPTITIQDLPGDVAGRVRGSRG